MALHQASWHGKQAVITSSLVRRPCALDLYDMTRVVLHPKGAGKGIASMNEHNIDRAKGVIISSANIHG